MGSANGRHRRPRQAPAIVVAAGVTGSAIAIPFLGAAGAHAADATTWDRVAECESGGMWSADLGNGYYGGLQFSQETWSAYGGTAFAERADLASRSQQISVAEKVLDDKGPQAWPSCAVISGLAVDGSLPGVDPGTAPAAEPTDDATTAPADEADEKGEAGSSGNTDSSGKAGKTGKTGKTGKSGKGEKEGGSDTLDPSGKPSAPPVAGKAGTPGSPDASQPSTSAPDASQGADGTGGKHRALPRPRRPARWARTATPVSPAGTPRGARVTCGTAVRSSTAGTPCSPATTSGRLLTHRNFPRAGPACTRPTRTSWAPTRI